MTVNARVFISHTTRDKSNHHLAKSVAKGLRSRNAQVWIAPDDIPMGSEWKPHIVKAVLQDCTHFLVILSAASITAPWVLEEIRLAEERRQSDPTFTILPLELGELGTYEGKPFIDQFQKIPYEPDLDEQLQTVVKTLQQAPTSLNRLKFDQELQELFGHFGFQVQEQELPLATSVLFYASSPRRNRSKLIVQSEFRDLYDEKINLDDVKQFVETVSRERNEGIIDLGYLVSNKEFALEAIEYLKQRPQHRFVFLVTRDELLQSLLDSHSYLTDFIQEYKAKRKLETFVELRALDMCGFPATSFEAIPGDVIKPAALSYVDFKPEGVVGVVLPSAEVCRLATLGFAETSPKGGVISLDLEAIQSRRMERGLSPRRRADYEFLHWLDIGLIQPDTTSDEQEKTSTIRNRAFTNTADLVVETVLWSITHELVESMHSALFPNDQGLRNRISSNQPEWTGEYSAFRTAYDYTQQTVWESILSNPSARPSLEEARNIKAWIINWMQRITGELTQENHPFYSSTLDLVRQKLTQTSESSTAGEEPQKQSVDSGKLIMSVVVQQFLKYVLLPEGSKVRDRLADSIKLVWHRAKTRGYRTYIEQEVRFTKILSKTMRDLLFHFGEHERSMVDLELITKAAKLVESDPTKALQTILFGRSRSRSNQPEVTLRKPRWKRDLSRVFAQRLLHYTEAEKTHSPDSGAGDFEPIFLDLLDSKTGSEAVQDIRLLSEQSALELLQNFIKEPNSNLMVVLGEFGAGKTTVTNRLMYELTKQKLAQLYDPEVRLPLLVNLRDYNKKPDFKDLVRSFLLEQAEMGEINLKLFHRLNNAGQFVLLLDGFDEMLSKVTKPDRRRCFLEIAEFVGPQSKVIITGRPGYFPDHAELTEVLEAMKKRLRESGSQHQIELRLICLQLMNDEELDQFLNVKVQQDLTRVKALFARKPNLRDLARRPVLAGIIAEAASELAQLGAEHVTLRRLYELYTKRWIDIEEDKYRYRVLIDSDKKSTFLRFLAMQMHLLGTLTVHFRMLDDRIAKHFNLDASDAIDHYSHDVRTCSFLTRSDEGEYRFIHKSFMEFFVALEYERLDDSPFAESFNKPLTTEMIEYLELSRLGISSSPSHIDLKAILASFESCIDDLNAHKEQAVAEQDFELAAGLRDRCDKVKKLLEKIRSPFRTMRRQDLKTLGLEQLKPIAKSWKDQPNYQLILDKVFQKHFPASITENA